jgi:hemerythrin superfamily protein
VAGADARLVRTLKHMGPTKEDHMDVTQLLEQDHRSVEGLFSTYERSQDDATLQQICRELEIHTTLEEEIVYPRLAELDREMEEHAEQEHAEAKELIAQIRAGDPDAANLGRQLQHAIQEHVREEESQAFPLLRERMADELDELGSRVAERKQKLTTDAEPFGV